MLVLPLALVALGMNLAGDDPHPSRALLKPKPAEVINLVEHRRTILSLVPEGTQVTKGQVVAELDSSALRDQLANQRIATGQAESQYQMARTQRENLETTSGLLPMNLAKQTDKARNYVELGKDMVVEGDRRVWECEAYGMFWLKYWALNKQTIAQETLKEAKVGLHVMEKVTKASKTEIAELLLIQAQSDELAKFSTLALERSKEAKLLQEIEGCKLLAPADGILVHANPANGRILIEEGATVRERQVVARILPY